MSDELESLLTGIITGRTAESAAQEIIAELGLEIRREQLRGGYRVIGKWIEEEQ
jgi:hypothetical protein